MVTPTSGNTGVMSRWSKSVLVCVAAVALWGGVAAPVHAAAPAHAEGRVIPRWAGRAERAQAFAQTRGGRVGWVVLNHRGVAVAGWRMHETFQSASVFKSMLLVCYLNDSRVRARALTRVERSRLGAMITRSSDDAANWAYGFVRQSCIYRLASNVGMRGFRTQGFWGRTQITPFGTANLFFRIDRRITARHRAQAMRWLRGVVPSQRWGLARPWVVPDGMAIAFKGGFAGTTGGGGRTVSQGALLSAPNGHRLGIAVLTNNSPSQAYGEDTIEGIGVRLLAGYRPLPAVRWPS
jgi:hypothetical protein